MIEKYTPRIRLRKVRKPNTAATIPGTATTASSVNADAVEGSPEQRQLGHLVPHHEVGQHVPVHALGPDLEHEVHAHGIGAEPEEDAVAQREHAGIAPDEIDPQRQDGVGEELAEEIQREVADVEGRALGQGVQQPAARSPPPPRRRRASSASRVRIAALRGEEAGRPPLDEEDDQRRGWPTLPNTAPSPGSMILLSPPMPAAATMVPASLPTPPVTTTMNESTM